MRKFSNAVLPAAALLLLFLASHPYPVAGYGSGADKSVCDTMIPSHGPQPQSSESPYKITLSKSALMGFETVDITLSTKSDSDIFKGFLIQVRKPGGDKALGEFKDSGEDPNVQPLNCFDIENSAMTHINPKEKKEVTVRWVAPNDGDAEYQIYYSVVGSNSGTFWAAVPHQEKLSVTRNAQATTAAPAIQMASETLLTKWRDFYGGCGETKGCFGMPGSCVSEYDPTSDNPTTCQMLLTWSKVGAKNVFQLTGLSGGRQSGYVAVGMSKDGFMGDDSVVGCAFDGSNSHVKRYHNPGQYNSIHSDPFLAIKEGQVTGNVDGHLFCSFEQENHKIGDLDINFDNDNFHYLLSRASSINGDSLPKHQPEGRVASPDAVHITDTRIMGASANNWLIQLHGGLMVIAWLLCASTGMFTARYFKQTHTDFMPMGKAFWFALHTFCMAATVFLTICGAIFIIIKKKGLYLNDWHPALGVVVIGLAILQVILAFFRPHPGTPRRPIFNWIHWGVGNSAHIVGIACIFLAQDLDLADLKRFGDKLLWLWIMMAIVLFHVLMHIIMSIHTVWADKQVDSTNKKRAMYPGPMKPNGLSSEAPGTGFRTFMLSLYLLVMAAGAIALVVLVFWPKDSNKDAPTS